MAGSGSDKIKIGSKKFKKMLDEIYREATDLCMDFNCKIAIFVASEETDEESPIYAFGLPSVESVVKAFVADSVPALSESEERSMGRCRELHRRLKELESETKAEKKRGKELMKRMMKSKRRNDDGPKMKCCWDDEAFLRKLQSGLMVSPPEPERESETEASTEFVPPASGSDDGEGKGCF